MIRQRSFDQKIANTILQLQYFVIFLHEKLARSYYSPDYLTHSVTNMIKNTQKHISQIRKFLHMSTKQNLYW